MNQMSAMSKLPNSIRAISYERDWFPLGFYRLHSLLPDRLFLQHRSAEINVSSSIASDQVDYHQMTIGNRA